VTAVTFGALARFNLRNIRDITGGIAMGESLSRAGGVAILGMAVSLAPLAMGVFYALRPSERRLALMRPLSLAAIFAACCSLLAGMANTLNQLGRFGTFDAKSLTLACFGGAESLMPMFVAFSALTVSWLCVAIGFRRSPA
jgi:hypothetical protein